MAHKPKKQKSNADKIDQLAALIGNIAQTLGDVTNRIKAIEESRTTIEPEIVDEEVLKAEIIKDTTSYKDIPYIVMKVDMIIPDNTMVGGGGAKKIFSGFKQFFNSKEEAGKFVDKMKKLNPNDMYEMMPA